MVQRSFMQSDPKVLHPAIFMLLLLKRCYLLNYIKLSSNQTTDRNLLSILGYHKKFRPFKIYFYSVKLHFQL